MNKYLKLLLAILSVPLFLWLAGYIGALFSSNAPNVIQVLNSIRNWDGLLLIGLISSASLVFFWQDLIFWMAKNHSRTEWTDDGIRMLARKSHIPIIVIVSIHIAFILWK